MAVILVTGADGQLGSEIKNLSDRYYGYDFIFTDIKELDISSAEKTAGFINDTKPDWVINCAAYNYVEKAEDDYESALLINGIAPGNIAEALQGSDSRLIHISTDYVFNGEANTPLNEDTYPDPLTRYGISKLDGERNALKHHATMIVRTSWLYSSYGSNFVKTIIAKAKQSESLKVVFDQVGSPTYAADLAGAILAIVSGVIRNKHAFNTGIYHFSNEGVCSWYDLALETVREAGISCRIEPVLSKDFSSAVKRPAYSVLDKTKIKETYNIDIPHWRTSLKKCIDRIQKL